MDVDRREIKGGEESADGRETRTREERKMMGTTDFVRILNFHPLTFLFLAIFRPSSFAKI